MMGPRLERAARHALWMNACVAISGCLLGCIDTPVSLGHHDVAAMEHPGGNGGANGGAVNGGSSGGNAMAPPSPCDTGTLSAMLECEVDDPFGGQPGGPPPRTMSASTTLTVARIDPGVADVTGVLAFDTWGLSFDGRVEGTIDCMRGMFHAVIADGTVTTKDMPPGEFYGELDGLIDPLDGTISGPWWHGPEPKLNPRCVGRWVAERD